MTARPVVRVGTALRLARGSVLGATWAFALLGVA